MELTFRPNPAVRPASDNAYCVGGPQVTPHIIAQQPLAPGENRSISPPLEAGRYRLRTLGLHGGRFLATGRAGAGGVTLHAGSGGWPSDETQLGSSPELRLENGTADAQLFILERMAWTDQAATAAEVSALQMFRDLFASEALRPGERIEVGSLTVLFTDLRESTRLYRESGDAVAFGHVMTHFDVLRGAISAEQGGLVKTIGDSVMAVFLRPIAGLRAVLAAQAQLEAQGSLPKSLRLKAGLHTGSCVAVTLNDRLDYFGSTVNIAARLEGLAASHTGVVVSAAVMEDPEVASWVKEGGLQTEPFEASLKGFEGERFRLWAVRPAGSGTTGAGRRHPHAR